MEYLTKHQRDALKAGLSTVVGFPATAFAPQPGEFDVAIGGPIDDIMLKLFFGPKGVVNPIDDPKLQNMGASQEVTSKSEAMKFDGGKADWTLVPFDGLEDMVRVLEFGAKKYARNNWQSNGGFNHTRVLNSLMRHLFAYSAGEDLDPESGISHIGHAQCNLLFLAHYLKHPEKFTKDDRFKG